jgi:Rieske Fe-S protein
MKNEFEITRRRFISWLGMLLAIPIVGLWYSTTRQTIVSNSSKTRKVKLNAISNGISFVEDVIIFRDQQGIQVFSSYCTHLGCNISKQKGEKLICPCHGSEYEASTGKVLQGPAQTDLANLSFEIKGDEILIRLP